jgi:hypothetical protein
MQVAYDEVKNSLFGKFLSCLMYGVGPENLGKLDFAQLSPQCSINGHEVDFRVVFGKFEQVLLAENMGASATTPPVPKDELEGLSNRAERVLARLETVECDWVCPSTMLDSVYDTVTAGIYSSIESALETHSEDPSYNIASTRGEIEALLSDIEGIQSRREEGEE